MRVKSPLTISIVLIIVCQVSMHVFGLSLVASLGVCVGVSLLFLFVVWLYERFRTQGSLEEELGRFNDEERVKLFQKMGSKPEDAKALNDMAKKILKLPDDK